MSDSEFKSAEAVALASLQTAENISRLMFEAVEAHQARQQVQIRETAEAIALILRSEAN